ncbi:hypothetical protein PBI_CHIDIEBERE_110 [Gordonia phage Chidiebere]|uniref:Uncharacterized protein n=1 Tax=Gordonia phage Chidiebere TaxID=2656530 RepID=A0A649VL89_9CAUD|nr:hypothetical protein PQD14_gp110 [Gordonia phage Chidiebere]QGJ93021.1 hypothetical protein PBI_CHIDIEBERE_110 [Gordonia phage Chidiebere]
MSRGTDGDRWWVRRPGAVPGPLLNSVVDRRLVVREVDRAAPETSGRPVPSVADGLVGR